MGLTHFPNGIASFGVPVLGGGPIVTTGNIFFVDSGVGSDSGSGTDSGQPFATIDYAIDRCTKDQGDYIIVMPGHAETIASATTLVPDIAGVHILGLGSGGSRPTLNFSATGSKIIMSAASVTIENFLFTGGVDLIVTMIEPIAADCRLLNIETRDVTGQMTDCIITEATADRLLIDGWVHRGAAAAGGDTALSIVGGDGITVRNFWIDGNFAVAGIQGVTTASTNLTLGGFDQSSYIRSRHATVVAITLHANGTGNIGPNIATRILTDADNITTAVVGAAMQIFQPVIICNADGEVGMETDITASTD